MPFNFPEPLATSTGTSSSLKYPLNLTDDGRRRNYFTSLSFTRYQPAYATQLGQTLSSVFTGIGAVLGADVSRIQDQGGVVENSQITLPIPQRLNDTNVMQWSQVSLTNIAVGSAVTASSVIPGFRRLTGTAANIVSGNATIGGQLLQAGSALAGVQINPFILQYFQQPQFRTFNFTWVLAPRNKQESNAINNIIYKLKARQAPRLGPSSLTMEYPDLVDVVFYPDDEYSLKLKRCIIQAVSVDYTPAGPSFINGNSAPTMVSLSISLKEAKFWWSEEWESKGLDLIDTVGAAATIFPSAATNPDAPEPDETTFFDITGGAP